jgi:protein TonB
MSENSVEKTFLYLLLISLLMHGALLAVVLNMPKDKPSVANEPQMVDLEGIPAYVQPKVVSPPVRRQAEETRRVEREIAPKGESQRDKPAPVPVQPLQRPSTVTGPGSDTPPQPRQQSVQEPGIKERSPSEALFRKRGEAKSPEASALYPGAEKMARLEESYRKKYDSEVADGEASFLNTDDIQFGSFLRRFENSVYGVWHYPAEAAKLGIEGITPVRITFNRRGEIVGRELLQSSGSKILDNEVLRTLDKVGPVGGFPRGYEKDTFKLIAFFHYGISQGVAKSLR